MSTLDLLADLELENLKNNGSKERYCDCDELVIGEGKQRHRVPCPPHHSCSYVRARNRLIPAAIEIASSRVVFRENEDSTMHGFRWSRAFSIAMDKLSAPLLRQSGNGTYEQKAV